MSDKTKIAVIDDEIDLCMMIKNNLEDTGNFEVVATSDPNVAENFVAHESPDLILLDIVMGGRKGTLIIEKLKKDDATKKIPIIVVSGKGEMVFNKRKSEFHWEPNSKIVQERGEMPEGKSAESLSEAYGVDDYISKPFDTELLIQVINEVLEKYRKKRAAEAAEDDIV